MFFSSSLLCFVLAVNPATVLSAPAPKFPANLIQRDTPSNEQSSNSETDAGSGFDFSVPGGPSAVWGGRYHHDQSEQSSTNSNSGGSPSSEQSSNSETDAGSGFDFSVPGGPSAVWGGHYHHDQSEQSESEPAPTPVTPTIVVPPKQPAPTPVTPTIVVPPKQPAPTTLTPVVVPPEQSVTPPAAYTTATRNPPEQPTQAPPPAPEGCPAPYESEPGVVVVCECE